MRIGRTVRAVPPAAGDDLPIFDELPLRAVEFAPRKLRPPGRRGPLAAAAWGLAIAGLVSVGMLTGEPTAEEAAAWLADATPPAPPATARPEPSLPSTRMGALLLQTVIALESPAPAQEAITTSRLEVAGFVLVRAARVEIALQVRDNRVLDHISVDVTDPNGGIRPVRTPTFSTTFELPVPRPSGTIWLVVAAYDEQGMPLGAIRRQFTVGPLLEPEIALADSSLMAERRRPQPRLGIGLAAPPPTCLPLSPTLASSC